MLLHLKSTGATQGGSSDESVDVGDALRELMQGLALRALVVHALGGDDSDEDDQKSDDDEAGESDEEVGDNNDDGDVEVRNYFK